MPVPDGREEEEEEPKNEEDVGCVPGDWKEWRLVWVGGREGGRVCTFDEAVGKSAEA